MKRYACVYLLAFLVVLSGCINTPKTVPSEFPEQNAHIADDTITSSPSDTIETNSHETEGTSAAIQESDSGLEQGHMPDNDIVAQFEDVTITKQTFQKTKTELETVVEELNKITLSRDYQKWLTYLSDDYRRNFSDKTVLEDVSDSLPTKGIRLKNLKDYFTFVFVPSRQNMRVDDIQFVSPTRVYVIMEITPDSPAAIYIIEKFSDGWKLVPKNH
ncbi:MAG TPA: hypothetical protein PK969_07975 [Treponemataceae bacterium]|jgi:hypothetical protein|nr:hypothetical protein [Treponemataceae bacterium]